MGGFLTKLNTTDIDNEINNDLDVINHVIKLVCEYINCNITKNIY